MGAPLARSLVRLPSPSLTLLFSPTVALTKFKLQASFVRCSRHAAMRAPVRGIQTSGCLRAIGAPTYEPRARRPRRRTL